MTQARPYAGVEASARLATRRDRLLKAGLHLLGSTVDPPELTVRGVCAEAGQATRYFYESFSDKDEFITAVFDWVVATLAGCTQAAVDAAPTGEQTLAAMTAIVRSIDADPRIGMLMFNSRLSNATVMRKRVESSAFFAMLSGHHAETVLQRRASERIKAGAQFVVGGVAQTISAWLA
ncbi:MAG: TetR/AcrR family transcriptional regulator, partial [Mycobacterium sp.]|nr:TetR/AcrR family transcriptional regulator [Mycobacterium sp.]